MPKKIIKLADIIVANEIRTNATKAKPEGVVIDPAGVGPFLALVGGTMSGAIAMGTNKITGVGDPDSAQDVATKDYVDIDAATVIKAGFNLAGGGTITLAAGGRFGWSARLIVIANGRGTHFSINGFFDITQPTSGTCTGVGGASNQTWNASGIPLGGAWLALYYILPIGSSSTSVAANFRLVNYTGDLEIPDHWILVAVNNWDSTVLKVCTGIYLRLGQSRLNQDGAGSGLDADALDGEEGAYYQPYWNRAGTILSPKTAGDDISLEFGDLISEQNPDAVNAIRIKATASDVDVVLGDGTGYFTVWNVADNNAVFHVDNVGNTEVKGYLDVNTHKILNVVDPTANQEAATKKYVDDNAGGRLVLIQAQSASNNAVIDFTSGIDGTYNTYLLVGSNIVPETDNVIPFLRVSIAGTFKSGASDYNWTSFQFNATGSNHSGDTADNEIQMGAITVGSAAGENCSFFAFINGPSNTALNKMIGGMHFNINQLGNVFGQIFSGSYMAGTEAIDGIQMGFLSGNVESGELALYGLAKT
ncbi:hypothetical protein LCGC14_0557440 [marine sediment metagenome]|uniref:Uncharacterized protein n=1 Tax=marine sediment metagenome TaxID=412755 RepID=A0A0F9UWA7_9ZZZZ